MCRLFEDRERELLVAVGRAAGPTIVNMAIEELVCPQKPISSRESATARCARSSHHYPVVYLAPEKDLTEDHAVGIAMGYASILEAAATHASTMRVVLLGQMTRAEALVSAVDYSLTYESRDLFQVSSAVAEAAQDFFGGGLLPRNTDLSEGEIESLLLLTHGDPGAVAAMQLAAASLVSDTRALIRRVHHARMVRPPASVPPLGEVGHGS